MHLRNTPLRTIAWPSVGGLLRGVVCASFLILADCAYSGDSDDDTLWEVNSRALPTTMQLSADCLLVRQAQDGIWRASDLEALQQQVLAPTTNPDTISDLAVNRVSEGPQLGFQRESKTQRLTVIYVHGNWTSPENARRRAKMIFPRLCRKSDLPVDFILYSWPSEREDGLARDIAHKKRRLDTDSLLLASLLRVLPREPRLSLIGFSFGGRVVCGALHLDAGGVLAGRQMPPADGQVRRVRVSLTAAAFDRASLGPLGRFSFALTNVDQVVNLYNSSDPILKRFRFFDRSTSPVAAGYAGLLSFHSRMPGFSPREEAKETVHAPGAVRLSAKIVQFDCERAVGRSHSEADYILKSPVFSQSLDNLLWR